MSVNETARTATATPDSDEQSSWQARAGARARLAAVAERFRRLRVALVNRRAARARWRARDVQRLTPFRSPPVSIAELAAYIRSGGWVPGECAPVLEAAGKAYGWLIAIPVSVVLYVVAWLVQRPSRSALTAAVAGFLWLTQVR